ncbi:uncharacterized protein LOC143301001 isoform X2 [Babylonia areolata]|uniref:uncharacterized protein LOC143301001 isoform X2 n=1 Tax=Babylonia areolata TaxID=304850 RepID=UPI003FCF95B4
MTRSFSFAVADEDCSSLPHPKSLSSYLAVEGRCRITADMELQFRDQGSSGTEITFEGITVARKERKILQDIWGVASPGEVLAVMGPSGAGKTTLLNALAGRESLEAGTVTYNGDLLTKATKRKLSYVLQEDVFFPNLTLRETLSFVAMLRLPDTLSRKEKMDKMNKVIDELDIRKCLDTIMGDAWERGLSGGEKKRASIACELITDPAIVFMDEPTSGLDYSTAASLIRTLRTIAESQTKTVVIAIHQPSSQMFFTFNNLLLLCEGQLAYFGPCKNVIDFFADVGFIMDTHYNPADFIMEKLKQGEETQSQILAAAKYLRHDTLSRLPAERGEGDQWRTDTQGSSESTVAQEDSNANTTENEDVRVSLMNLGEDKVKAVEVGIRDPEDHKWPTGWLTQYLQLTLRTFRQSRTRILSKLKIIESVVLCVLVSLVWFQLPRTEETLRDRMGVIFFTIIHWGFTPLFDAVSSFPMEKVIIHKERSAGWYRLSAYYLAKMTSELPLIIVQPAIFVVVSYWCVGLNGVLAFFGTCLTIIINAMTGQSIGLLMGIACMDFRKAMAIATIFMMSIMLLGGFYTRNLPFWLDWLKYLSFLHFSFHSAMVLEFTDAPPIQCAASPNASQFPQCLQPNVTHVSSQDVLGFYHMDLTFWQYLLPLFLFILVGRLAGYLVLRFIFRPRFG